MLFPILLLREHKKFIFLKNFAVKKKISTNFWGSFSKKVIFSNRLTTRIGLFSLKVVQFLYVLQNHVFGKNWFLLVFSKWNADYESEIRFENSVMQDWRWLTMHRFRAKIFSMNEFKTISRTLFASEFLISTLFPDFHHVEVVFWKISFIIIFLRHLKLAILNLGDLTSIIVQELLTNDFTQGWTQIQRFPSKNNYNRVSPFFQCYAKFYTFPAAILKILMKINFFHIHGFEAHIKIARLLMKTGRFEWSNDLKKLLFWKNYLRNWSKFSF